jgi:hypothetical protein
MEIPDNNDNEAKINTFYYILYVISNSFPIIPNQENRNKLIKYLTNFKQNNLNFNLDNFLKHNEDDLNNFNFELDDTIDIVKNNDFNEFISKQKEENEILKNNFLKKNKPNDTYQEESINDFVSKIISKYDTFNKIEQSKFLISIFNKELVPLTFQISQNYDKLCIDKVKIINENKFMSDLLKQFYLFFLKELHYSEDDSNLLMNKINQCDETKHASINNKLYKIKQIIDDTNIPYIKIVYFMDYLMHNFCKTPRTKTRDFIYYNPNNLSDTQFDINLKDEKLKDIILSRPNQTNQTNPNPFSRGNYNLNKLNKQTGGLKYKNTKIQKYKNTKIQKYKNQQNKNENKNKKKQNLNH